MSISTSDPSIDGLQTFKEADSSAAEVTIVAPSERLKDANVLREIHSHLVNADEASERNRSKVQDLKDVKPPLRSDLLRARGQSGRFNINFGDTAALIHEAEAGYVDSFVSPQHLVPIKLKRDSFEPSAQQRFERIMSDEFTMMIRGWSDGLFTYMTMVDQFVTHGVAVGYFRDREDWQWSAAGLREFKFPRRTKASSGAIEVTTCEVQMAPSELAEKIVDPDIATALGWNVKEVKRVLATTHSALYDDESPEDVQERDKANDFDRESNPFDSINLVYGWVNEMDGKVSYYITTKAESDSTGKSKGSGDFLFRQRGAYEEMGEAIHLFSFHTGNKGNIYTIRGLGYMVYAQFMASNLLQCAFLDSVKDSMSVKYYSPTEKGITTLPIINAGPYSFLPQSMTVVPDQKAPDLSRTAVPALQLLRDQAASKSSASTISSVFNNAPDRRSSSEAMAAVEHFNSLNSAAMLLWSRPWRDLIVESVRRAFRGGQNTETDSGRMAEEMRKACIARGVPASALSQIDLRRTKTSIPVGPGSAAARAAQSQQGAALYQSMDPVGRANYDRNRAVQIWGPEEADQYIPDSNEPRELHDHAIARLENNDLVEGQEVRPSESENALVHLSEHVPRLIEYIQLVEEGQMELTDATQEMLMLYEHAVATFEMAVVPEIATAELNQYKQQLQQIGEYVNNGVRAIQKMQREGEMQAGQEGGEGPPPEEIAKMQAHQAQMERDAQTAMMKLQQNDAAFRQSQIHNQQKALQEIAINDAKAASEISR